MQRSNEPKERRIWPTILTLELGSDGVAMRSTAMRPVSLIQIHPTVLVIIAHMGLEGWDPNAVIMTAARDMAMSA